MRTQKNLGKTNGGGKKIITVNKEQKEEFPGEIFLAILCLLLFISWYNTNV